MIGLEDRLRSVAGVESITIELGDEGLEAIRVSIAEGADEAEVLEDIRRILIAYGLRSRRPGLLRGRREVPEIVPELKVDPPVAGRPEPEPTAEPKPVAEPATEGALAGGRPAVRVRPGGKGLVVSLTDPGGRVVEATADRTPMGAAEAMARAVVEWHGWALPDKVSVIVDHLDGEPVVTMLVRRGEGAGASAALVGPSLPDALYEATVQALATLAEEAAEQPG